MRLLEHEFSKLMKIQQLFYMFWIKADHRWYTFESLFCLLIQGTCLLCTVCTLSMFTVYSVHCKYLLCTVYPVHLSTFITVDNLSPLFPFLFQQTNKLLYYLGTWIDSTLYTLHCTLYPAHFTLYTLHCTLYTVHFTVPCTLYTVRTLYPVHLSTSLTVDHPFPLYI